MNAHRYYVTGKMRRSNGSGHIREQIRRLKTVLKLE
jgi:hypothetical protein